MLEASTKAFVSQLLSCGVNVKSFDVSPAENHQFVFDIIPLVLEIMEKTHQILEFQVRFYQSPPRS
jgi:hypothetical protein